MMWRVVEGYRGMHSRAFRKRKQKEKFLGHTDKLECSRLPTVGYPPTAVGQRGGTIISVPKEGKQNVETYGRRCRGLWRVVEGCGGL